MALRKFFFEFDLRLLHHDIAWINRPAVPKCRTAIKTKQQDKKQHIARKELRYLHETSTSFLPKRAHIAARDATAELVAMRASDSAWAAAMAPTATPFLPWADALGKQENM